MTALLVKHPHYAQNPLTCYGNQRYHAPNGSMALIGWHNKPDSWVVAGWAFRQVLEDVRSQCPTDAEMVSELELARDLKYLFIDSFSGDLAERLANAIRNTASGILSGQIRSGLLDKPYGDAKAIAEYRSALRELVAVVSDRAV